MKSYEEKLSYANFKTKISIYQNSCDIFTLQVCLTQNSTLYQGFSNGFLQESILTISNLTLATQCMISQMPWRECEYNMS